MPNARYWSRSKPFCAVVCILCYLISIPNIIQVLMCKYSGKYYRLRGIIIEERYKAGKAISPVVRFKFNDEKGQLKCSFCGKSFARGPRPS